MPTHLKQHNSLNEKILEGVNILADYVASTLGPKGQNVLIRKKDGQPYITKDGVTVAKNVSFEDPFANAAADIVKQASARTNTEAGDGTTTSTILTRELLNQSSRLVASGVAPIELKRGLDQCLQSALEALADLSSPVTSISDIEHIATISANNDKSIGELVATAVDQVGKNGTVTIQEARSHETTLELVEGFKIPSGYAARAFVTDERKGICKYDDPIFLITDQKIEQVNEILPSLEIAAREGRPFVIVADDIEGQALAALIMNSMRGSMKVAAIKAPFYGEERRSSLSDLAITTGAKFFQRSLGHKLTEVSLTDFGGASTVEITSSTTTIVDGQGCSSKIQERIDSVRGQLEKEEDMRVARRLQDRMTRLNSGVAIINVGANTEVEMIEKLHRIEDALEAVKSAQLEGIVPGGGMTLINISQTLKVEFANELQATSLGVFKRALEAPIRTMASNSGMSPDLVLSQIENLPFGEGMNFATSKTEDLLTSGVIDPTKVTRCSLKNAVSVAGTLLLTNHGIVES